MQHRNWKVWHKHEKRWLDYLVMLPSGRVGEIADDGSVVCLKDSDVDVIFQTGLKSKSGVDIYEGDILSVGNNAVVSFHRGAFAPRYDRGTAEEMEDPFYTIAASCEVIGNVWENPELLTK